MYSVNSNNKDLSNKKIKNATTLIYKDIKFRSKSEVTFYKMLEELSNNVEGIEFAYEPRKFIVYPSTKYDNINIFKPSKESYIDSKGQTKKKFSKYLFLQEGVFRAISYTPDFLITKGHNIIFIDIKGWTNDTYPIKMKMFLGVLANEAKVHKDINYTFAEPHNTTQMKQIIDYIKNL
jgi:hypothetical protein